MTFQDIYSAWFLNQNETTKKQIAVFFKKHCNVYVSNSSKKVVQFKPRQQ